MHILFLLAEKLRRNAVQTVRAELVVAEHVGQHIEHHPSVDAGFHVFAFTVRAALESCVPEYSVTRNTAVVKVRLVMGEICLMPQRRRVQKTPTSVVQVRQSSARQPSSAYPGIPGGVRSFSRRRPQQARAQTQRVAGHRKNKKQSNSLHRRHLSFQTPPLGELIELPVLSRQGLGSVEQVRHIEVLDVVTREDVWVSHLHELTPLHAETERIGNTEDMLGLVKTKEP